MWFLLGYAARLGGDYKLSLQGYERGLQRRPNSIQGLSGEAQTYARMDRIPEAQDLLKKVLAANPKSAQDFKAGKPAALNFLKGQVMKASKGKANPGLVGEILERKLK